MDEEIGRRKNDYGAVVINDGLIANYAPDSDKRKRVL